MKESERGGRNITDDADSARRVVSSASSSSSPASCKRCGYRGCRRLYLFWLAASCRAHSEALALMAV